MEYDRVVQRLSVRETEVLKLAALGLRNHGIAERMDLSLHAVKFHLASVYRKLEVANRTEAAVVYLESINRRPRRSSTDPKLREEAN